MNIMAADKLGNEELLAKIEELGNEIEQIEIEMNRAAKAVTDHYENKPPDLPGRKHQRALKRWYEQLQRENARYERLRDEGLQKCEQLKGLMTMYKRRVEQNGGSGNIQS